MNIKKISVAARKIGRLEIFDRVDADGAVQQWVSVGGAFYPLERMPYLELEHLRSVFLLTDKQAEDMLIDTVECPDIDMADYSEGEQIADYPSLTIKHNGYELLALYVKGAGNTFLVDKDLLAPVIGTDGEENYYLRKAKSGRPYFAVKNGLFLRGIVAPVLGSDQLKDKLRRTSQTLY